MDSATLAKQITDYDTTRKGSVDTLNDAMKQYGIPEIRGRVAGLRTTLSNTESALNAVDPSVTGRVQGSLVTEAQRQRQVANERAPIAEQYGQQSRALNTESANMSDQMQAAKLLAESGINDWTAGRTALQSRYQDATTREAEARRQMEADREYQLQVDSAKRGAQGAAGYSVGGGKQTAPKANIAQRKDGGFNFTDTGGNTISAAKYSQLTGQPLGNVLYNMGQKGDKYAQQLYNQIQLDPFFGKGNAAYDSQIKKQYSAIFWGA